MKVVKDINTLKIKIRLLYFLALNVILALILASNISMLYFTGTAANKMIISSILLTISGVIISIPVYITNNALKNVNLNNIKTSAILLNIAGTALLMILIYILLTIYKFLTFLPL